MRIVQIGLWVLVALCGVAVGTYYAIWNSQYGQPTASQSFGTPFELVTHRGEKVTEQLFKERPTAVYFGYTHCPDFCPATLYQMTLWAKELGQRAENMNFVFVTVDPDRDTVDYMNEYITTFSDRIIGITGPRDKVEDMLRGYKVYFNKVPTDDGDYAMDHVTSVYLLNDNGGFAGSIGHSEIIEEAVAKLQNLIE